MDMDTMIGRKNAAGDPVNIECREYQDTQPWTWIP